MDQLLRGLDGDKAIRVVTAVTTRTVGEAIRRHQLRGASAVVLGRALTAGCLMTTLTKDDDERVRITVRGDGVLGSVLVDAHGDGRMRGCFTSERAARTNLPVDAGRARLGPMVGAGQVSITRDLGLEKTYQGVVELLTGELDEDLERYLGDSEQLPSVLRCHVMLGPDGEFVRAAGVLAQTFPGSDPARLDPIRRALDGLPDVLLQERGAEDLLGFVLGGQEHHVLEPTTLRFACGCGRERARSVVSTLGAADIDALADEQGGTDVRCSYCGDAYSLTEADLRGLAVELRERRS